jgi:starch synthase (maltosyl-transferring)
VIVIANLDSHGIRETMVHLDMPLLGMGWHDGFAAHDLVIEQTWHWGENVYVRLDPHEENVHIVHVRGL